MKDRVIDWEWDCSFPTKGGHRVSLSFACVTRFDYLGLIVHQSFTQQSHQKKADVPMSMPSAPLPKSAIQQSITPAKPQSAAPVNPDEMNAANKDQAEK